ncbi:MAG TPA: DNA cytosine methyltransferase, partial [Armatimonadota bacterium]|nr:DNA cytosine methyltransferase [Armatimonadota bacterium]
MPDVDNTKELTILSLCAGYGGLELGLARSLENPLRVVAVEIEAFALANLEAKAAQGALAIDAMWPDLKTFPAERFRGCFDFVIGGYPCQPFSHAGKRQGEDDPRHLWPYIAEIVRAVQPVWCFFENVAGHLSLGFPAVYRSLRAMGYQVEAGLFTAAECGAPHKRQRLFILAHRPGGGRETVACGKTSDSQRQRSNRSLDRGRLLNGSVRCGAGELANSAELRFNGLPQRGQTEAIAIRGLPKSVGRGCDRWPAGPGQPQYEWEEPRVVDDTK